jgi:hypothetical protein
VTGTDVPLDVLGPPPLDRQSGQKTAAQAVGILVALGQGFHQPTKSQRRNLSVVMAEDGRVIYGDAFDVVKLPLGVDADDMAALRAVVRELVFYEVKSTNKGTVKADWSGYFFSLSTAELLSAQALKERFRFAFVNVLTKKVEERTLGEVFARARAVYPTWSISF